MIELKIEWEGLDEWEKHLNDTEKKYIPTAIKDGINVTGQDVKKALIKKMKRVFHKPNRYTLNSVYIIPARKGFVIATIGVKGDQNSYLNPQIYGGGRGDKPSEASMKRKRKLTKSLQIVPGKAMRLDKHGNITKGKMTKIMSVIKGHRKTRLNTTERSKGRNKKLPDLFVVKKNSRQAKHLHPGIYQRYGRRGKRSGSLQRKIKPILIYGRKSNYIVRFRFYDVAQKVIDKKLTKNVMDMLDRLLRRRGLR